jgi:2-polyprenyl-6-hydroxyphenyl methylase/3-demethylubiquinone-9 3-methyltransferase
LAAAGQRFDLVISSEVIEHVQDPAEFVRVLGALVAPGGDLVMTTINRTIKSYLLTIVLAEHVAKIIPQGERPSLQAPQAAPL